MPRMSEYTNQTNINDSYIVDKNDMLSYQLLIDNKEHVDRVAEELNNLKTLNYFFYKQSNSCSTYNDLMKHTV